MDRKEIEKIVFDVLERCGFIIPVEAKFDYSCTEEPEKAKEFVRLTKGNWRNAIYVRKEGERYGDSQYFDLLCAVNEKGEPICIPVPIARELFNEPINGMSCMGWMTGSAYEAIYKRYYEKRNLPF